MNHSIRWLIAIVLLVPITVGAQDFGSLLRGALSGRAPDLAGLIKSVAELTEGQLGSNVEGPTGADGKVVLYSTPWCGYCKRAVTHMKNKNIPFVERDIERDSENRAEYTRLGGKGGVPFIVLGQQTMIGFDAAVFDRQYARFRAAHPAPISPAASANVTSADTVAAAPQPGDALVGKIAGIKVHVAPQRKSTSLLTLAKGEAVVYMGEERDGFYRVTSSAGEGWVDRLLVRQN